MTTLRAFVARLRALFIRDRRLSEEIESHLHALTEEHRRRGLSEEEARAAARRAFGNALMAEDYRAQERLPFVDAAWQDFKLSWRRVRSRGASGVLTVGLLALALGASTTVFSAADSFVFNRTPFPNQSRVAVILSTYPRTGVSDYLPPSAVAAWRRHADIFSQVAVHWRAGSSLVSHNGVTEAIGTRLVSANLFGTLGVQPAFGRPFLTADESDAQSVAMVSHRLATWLFGDATQAVGRVLPLDGARPRIIGVMPPSFRFAGAADEIWRPLDLPSWDETSGVQHVVELAPGASLTSAAKAVAGRATLVHGGDVTRRPTAVSLQSLSGSNADGRTRILFLSLAGGALALLLLGCPPAVDASPRRIPSPSGSTVRSGLAGRRCISGSCPCPCLPHRGRRDDG